MPKTSRWKAPMVRHHKAEYTTITPVNFALRGKTTKVRVFWSMFTIVDVLILAIILTLQASLFLENGTSAVTRMSKNQAPFPAVTLCNLNPYKKSVLDTIPQMVQLISHFTNASKATRNASASSAVTDGSVVGRRRRQAAIVAPYVVPYQCSCQTPIKETAIPPFSSVYYRLVNGYPWECALQCCSANNPNQGLRAQLARFDSTVIQVLVNNSLIDGSPAWCDLWKDMSGSYHWYEDPNRSVVITELCPNCMEDPTASQSNPNGAVTVKADAQGTKFANAVTNAPVLCQYVNDSAVIPSSRTASPASSSSTSTSSSSSSTKMVSSAISTATPTGSASVSAASSMSSGSTSSATPPSSSPSTNIPATSTTPPLPTPSASQYPVGEVILTSVTTPCRTSTTTTISTTSTTTTSTTSSTTSSSSSTSTATSSPTTTSSTTTSGTTTSTTSSTTTASATTSSTTPTTSTSSTSVPTSTTTSISPSTSSSTTSTTTSTSTPSSTSSTTSTTSSTSSTTTSTTSLPSSTSSTTTTSSNTPTFSSSTTSSSAKSTSRSTTVSTASPSSASSTASSTSTSTSSSSSSSSLADTSIGSSSTSTSSSASISSTPTAEPFSTSTLTDTSSSTRRSVATTDLTSSSIIGSFPSSSFTTSSTGQATAPPTSTAFSAGISSTASISTSAPSLTSSLSAISFSEATTSSRGSTTSVGSVTQTSSESTSASGTGSTGSNTASVLISSSITTNLPPVDPQLSQAIQDLFRHANGDAMVMSTLTEDSTPYIIASLPPELAVKAGYDLSEVMMRCVYDGVPCLERDFTRNVDPNYGNCYTFNKHGDHPIATKPGAATGLSITYNVGDSMYADYIQMAGVRVVIHGQNEPVFPDVMGIDAPSGYQTAVAMRKVRTLDSTLCASSPADVHTYYFDNTYSIEACLRSCYQKEILQKCQCGDPRVPLPKGSQSTHCDLTKRGCVNDYYSIDTNKTCNCPSACQFDQYELSNSIARWPNSIRNNGSVWLDSNETTHQEIGNNLARIDVFFDSLLVLEYVEATIYTWQQLAWDMSAVIGLMLNASVISLFEIVHLIRYFCNR